jgi:hypothetical protein
MGSRVWGVKGCDLQVKDWYCVETLGDRWRCSLNNLLNLVLGREGEGKGEGRSVRGWGAECGG